MRRIAVLPKDGGGRLLALVVAVMTYLASLGLGGGTLVAGAVQGWTGSLNHRLTIQAPPGGDVPALLGYVRTHPGVVAADVLSDKEIARLLRPWLGEGFEPGKLPLPHLIDVTTDARAPPDLDALREGVAKLDAKASLDDHRAWLGDVLNLAALARALCYGTAALIALATIAIVVFATRAGLTQHRDVVEVLHLIGARDGAIAGAFQRQVGWIALQGGIFGASLAAATLYGLGRAATQVGDPLLTALQPGFDAYLALVPVPFAVALLAVLTGRATVLRLLEAEA